MKYYIRVFAVLNIAFGLMAIVNPGLWYELTPGASDTGPLNVHFVRDIGIAFFAAGFGLWLGVAQSQLNRLSGPAVAVTFIGGHAVLHTYEMFVHHFSPTAALRDSLLIIVPALLAIVWLFSEIRKQQAEKF